VDKKIKILIADDQELIRQSLQIILSNEPDFTVTENAANGLEVIRSVRRERPDVILMDIRMPEMDGVVCTQIIKENYPDIKIIILTTFDDDEYVFNALKFGASGYLLKGISIEELTKAIRKVYQGNAMINEDIASKVVRLFSQMAQGSFSIQVDEKQSQELKENEWEIIVQVGRGLSNKEIASALNLSEGTVRNNLSHILSKLGLRDRTQLAIWAVQTGAVNRRIDSQDS
jgi:DNA-binding NarL/FixJ family response regulator